MVPWSEIISQSQFSRDYFAKNLKFLGIDSLLQENISKNCTAAFTTCQRAT